MFPLERLAAADEAFLTSSVREVMPVTAIDGAPVGDGAPGPGRPALQQALRGAAATLSGNERGEDPARRHGAPERRARARPDGVGVRDPPRGRRARGRVRAQAVPRLARDEPVAPRPGPARGGVRTAAAGEAERSRRRSSRCRARACSRRWSASRSRAGDPRLARCGRPRGSSLAGLLSLAPAALALRGGELAAYHGAEHISIGTYEHGARRDEGARALRRRIWSARSSLTTAAGNVARRPRARARRGTGPRGGAARRARRVDRDLRLDDAPSRAIPSRRRCRGPGHELQHRLSTAEPIAGPARGRRGGAGACLALELEHGADDDS